MKTTSLAIFSEEEHTLNKNLDALFREWSDFLLSIGFWEKYDDTHTVMRIATSWATRMEEVRQLLALL